MDITEKTRLRAKGRDEVHTADQWATLIVSEFGGSHEKALQNIYDFVADGKVYEVIYEDHVDD